ncbi:glycosyltransferase [Fictibacillus sp. Mic-4]|uniref:glycosyltransferase n=1 Tax=Fictibacillus sp. Mic-4 TaxID=3132826 RepID=UPI003CEABCC5
MRTETIDFRAFMRKEWRDKEPKPTPTPLKIIRLGYGLFVLMAPKTVFAGTADATFGNVWSAGLNIVDWIAVGVFFFAGVSWMFGHRSKSLELLIGGACGYILARHAVDIKNFLRTI